MKFGEKLLAARLRDWSLYYIDYNGLKHDIKQMTHTDRVSEDVALARFTPKFDAEVAKAAKFLVKKLQWCSTFYQMLQERMIVFEKAGQWQYPDRDHEPDTHHDDSSGCSSHVESNNSSDDSDYDDDDAGVVVRQRAWPCRAATVTELHHQVDAGPCDTTAQASAHPASPRHEDASEYLYAKKMVSDYARELRILEEYVQLNRDAIRKILKKFDRHVGTAVQQETLARLQTGDKTKRFWFSDVRARLRQAEELQARLEQMKPHVDDYERRKVYTIGCFDVFHHAHENLLKAMREFGAFIVVGVHDDASYYKLKKKHTVHNTQQRVENVKQFADMVYVIPDTDPTPWIKAMISDADVKDGLACYVRGEDMLDFPGREFVEDRMPVYFVPRTEGVSSTLLRAVYHNDDPTLAAQAAFAETDETGKPIAVA